MEAGISTAALAGVGTSIIALLFALYLTRYILRQDFGSDRVEELSNYVQQGARTFMLREFRLLVVFAIIVAAGLSLMPTMEGAAQGWEVAIGFGLGTIASGLAGWIGMMVATKANGRTAHAAESSFSQALNIAYSGGATMGFSVVGLGLLGLSVLYYLFPEKGHVWLGYAFGGSGVALFLRVGGGIYTKAADVGADVVGKVEAGIPEDDPRNPAVIADNVGDNVGDVAGMGSDLYESFVSAVAATMVLGMGVQSNVEQIGNAAVFFPLLLGSAGIIASVIGSLFVRAKEDNTDDYEAQARQAQKALNMGPFVANLLILLMTGGLLYWLFPAIDASALYPEEAIAGIDMRISLFLAIVSGLITGVIIGYATQYYTSEEYSPVRQIADSSDTGAATNIIEGLGTGMMSTVIPAVSVGVATLLAFFFAGLYGIALASTGMLLSLGVVLAMDAYGPITDNAAGISEMADLGEDVRGRCEALDAVGNTTAAIGKGFAIGSAALAALAWLATFFHEAEHMWNVTEGLNAGMINSSLIDPSVLVGLILGAMLTFYLSAVGIRATSRGASKVVEEVRRQFDELDGVREGERDPEYNSCVDITTTTALREMMIPGVVVLIVPILVGIIPMLGINAVAGLLAGVLITGFLMAVFMSNAGGAWDNAKKYIESGEHGGKGSPAHKASVIGDTVGDPLKDTSGPSLNVLIKLMGKVAVIFLPLFVLFA